MTLATLLPTSDESSSGTLVLSSGTAHWSLLDDNDGATNNVQFNSNGFVSMNYGDMPSAPTVNSVRVTAYYRSIGAFDTQQGRVFVKIGSTKYYGSYNDLVVSAWSGTITHVFLTNPATGNAWTAVEVNALIAGFELSSFSANSAAISYVPVEIDYVAAPAQVQVSRHVATFALHTLRNPEQVLRFTGAPSVLGTDSSPLELLAEAQLEHIAGPHPDGDGWGTEIWERRVVSAHSISESPDDYTVELELKDNRYLKTLLWFPAYSNRPSGILEDGVPRMAVPGSTFTFARSTNETFTDPVGNSVTVPPNVPGYALGGLQILAGTRAYFSNNSTARVWNAPQGAAGAVIKFLGTLAQDRVILYSFHDSNNWAKLWYEHASARFKFAIRAGGSTTTISSLAAPTVGPWYQVCAYWTGTNLENGHAAHTMALYVDGVLQATGVASGAMTEVASSNFDIGSEAGTNELRGQIRNVFSLQWVPTPKEMEELL